MPNFMLAYHGGNPPETKEDGMAQIQAWKAWTKNLGDAVVNSGTPLGKSKSVTTTDIADGGGTNPMSGFSVVETHDMDAATAIAQSGPFCMTDGTIIVSEMMSMPGS